MKRKLLALILILTMTATMENLHVNISRAAEEDHLGTSSGFLLADEWTSATVYVDTNQEEVSRDGDNEYCGLKIIADTFAEDVERVTGTPADVATSADQLSGNVIIAGTIGHNEVIDTLISNGSIDVSGLYKDGELKWDCYQMQFVNGDVLSSCGYSGINQALVITGSNKRGAMYGLFHISERIGVSPWVYMADAVPVQYPVPSNVQ